MKIKISKSQQEEDIKREIKSKAPKIHFHDEFA
jgi:phage antirepressor YoqD-like protein